MNCTILHEYCKGCQKERVAQQEGPLDKATGKPSYRPGDFIVKCGGIPGDGKFVKKMKSIKGIKKKKSSLRSIK